MSDTTPEKKPTPDEATKVLNFVDGVLGSAGHSVDDPEARELLRKQAAGELTGDEARALFRKQQGLD